MTTATTTFAEQSLGVLGGQIRLWKGGKGDPVLVLGHDQSYPKAQPFHEMLARQSTVYVPSHPGFHGSEPPAWEWVMNVRDLAVAYQYLLKALGLKQVTVVGVGFGGWIAAEMATMCEEHFKKLVLVGAMGIQPKVGEIYDQFIVNSETYARKGFLDQKKFDEVFTPEPQFDQLEHWETDREMTCRVAWKPYMYNPTLPRLLNGISVPTLIVWGRQDEVVPLECGEMYHKAIRGSRLEVIDRVGHAADLEKPNEVARLVTSFLGK